MLWSQPSPKPRGGGQASKRSALIIHSYVKDDFAIKLDDTVFEYSYYKSPFSAIKQFIKHSNSICAQSQHNKPRVARARLSQVKIKAGRQGPLPSIHMHTHIINTAIQHM